MVNLTRIYTRTGDDGTTALGDLSRVHKTDPRLAAYADVDEANAAIGLALAFAENSVGMLDDGIRILLRRIQNEMFDLGADLSTPLVENPEFPPLRIEQAYVDRLEAACDEWNATLSKLRSFILNGGTVVAAQLHVARTVTRRAERSAWAAVAEYGDGINPLAVKYLNRLSDLLFILARVANTDSHGGEGDVLWVPGGER
ncbi:MAG: ATP:cob(I)alamin adenosyltransferase [Catenulispora sp. 13_1_20CM_3_70_7]|jgi:cob(I)alamin adenosyltransferase|nr:cob(I)yrinic acid a,c-diamide adenosyltransferase [Catenulisporales bacterium]OLE24668.1 MAG: ATP:cob(I)alamin adenosyltransferase [Catenulispora sp. 13_1_20CM_3_70_7]